MSQDILPPRLRMLYTAMSEYPSEKGIKLNGQVLITGTGIFLAIAALNGYDIQEGVLAVWLSAPLIMMGLGNWVQSIKLKGNTPPSQPSVPTEDVAATAGTAAATAAVPSAAKSDVSVPTIGVPAILAAHSHDPGA